MDKIPHLVDPTDFVCSYLRVRDKPINCNGLSLPHLLSVCLLDFIQPRRGDLDMNKHVNNVTYIGWMLEVRWLLFVFYD